MGIYSPVGFLTSALSAEALIGLLSFAIATGLFWRFSRPTAFLKFSHNAVIAPTVILQD
jgi:inward rectifier potassium channel